MITFDQALFHLYQEGEISYEDALKYADSANEVRLMIKLQNGMTPSSTTDQGIDAMSLVRDEDPRNKR